MERRDIKPILLIEETKQTIEVIRSTLKKRMPEIKVDPVATLQTALKRLKENDYHLILTNFVLKQAQGKELLQRLKEVSPHTPLITLTNKKIPETAADMIKMGADDCIEKNRESLKSLPDMIEKILLRREFSFAGPLTTLPKSWVEKWNHELDQLLARTNLIAKNATNAPIIDSLQEKIGKLKRLTQQALPS